MCTERGEPQEYSDSPENPTQELRSHGSRIIYYLLGIGSVPRAAELERGWVGGRWLPLFHLPLTSCVVLERNLASLDLRPSDHKAGGGACVFTLRAKVRVLQAGVNGRISLSSLKAMVSDIWAFTPAAALHNATCHGDCIISLLL